MAELYLDEDTETALVEVLAQRGISAVHVDDMRRKGYDDPDQLRFATSRVWIIVVYNMKHCRSLHRIGVQHAGIIGLGRSDVPRTALRIAMVLDLLDANWVNRMIVWSEVQQQIEKGLRIDGYTDAEVRYAIGR